MKEEKEQGTNNVLYLIDIFEKESKSSPAYPHHYYFFLEEKRTPRFHI